MTKEKTMGTPAAAGPVPEIERLYRLRDRAEVLRFLRENPFLISLVREAYNPIQKHFAGAQVFLEVSPDAEAEHEELLISIETDLDVGKARANLKRFDHDWWLHALDRAQGKVCIDVEFR
ncbi:MAG: hypothetical protein HY238_20540 [Acidobacteria bacterium]|nr:hypothetical protein [Acidobacteriota bacterium]